MNNRVLAFMDDMHRFERENELFGLQENGIRYWDIARLRVFEKLFYTYYNDDRYYQAPAAPATTSTPWQKLVKVIKWAWWMTVNEINFRLFTPKKRWLFLKISRFHDPQTGKTYDAVADEIAEALKDEATSVETFKNPQTDITRIGHRYQTYHLYTYRKLYSKRRFQPGKTYALAALLRERFPMTKNENWDALIQQSILEFEAECRFAERLLRKVQPQGLFFTGGAKGFIQAARTLGIRTIEIQHSPLNTADLCYSYASGIDYSPVLSIPEYLLVNSEAWQERIHYPPAFVNVGSDYFYRSSRLNPSIVQRNKVLFVSDPLNHDRIKSTIRDFIGRNDLPGLQVVFKLHSAETDRYAEAKTFFADRPEVEVILNERNISELLDESCATFIIYSTVAYQAVQKGLQVFLLKTGYYEGGYDLFDLPNVQLIGLDEPVDMQAITEPRTFTPIQFFEPFDREKLERFIAQLATRPGGPSARKQDPK